jgi:hypothetical protein
MYIVVERGARCNCTGTREKVHWVLVPSPEGSSVRRPRYLSEVMTVGGCVSVPSCLWNSTTSLAPACITTTLYPQHQRYPRNTQHSTPKGVSALPQYLHNRVRGAACIARLILKSFPSTVDPKQTLIPYLASTLPLIPRLLLHSSLKYS